MGVGRIGLRDLAAKRVLGVGRMGLMDLTGRRILWVSAEWG